MVRMSVSSKAMRRVECRSVAILLVLTTLPDRSTAEALAQTLVDTRLAACVNVLASCRSFYHWQGALEVADEVLLIIKTSDDRYVAVEAAIRAQHPYDLPEVIALPVAGGLPEYLAWASAQTSSGAI